MNSTSSDQVKQKVHALGTALILLTIFCGVEVSAGILSHSLSLLSDAEHLLSDVASLGLALGAIGLSRAISQSSSSPRFDRDRLEVLAALVNGIGLAFVAGWIIKEAVVRLQSPAPEILGVPMLVTALLGLVVNSLNVFCLHGCSHQDLNVKGVFLHLLADLVSSVGTVLAAIAVIWFDWAWADGVISLVVAGLIALFAATLVTQSINCLRRQVAGVTTETSTEISNISCLCGFPEDCSDREKAEKILFPNLLEII
jgi:cobalt-zinc-cadmium efflux system protein